ncbi:hypothetical protein K490DRAFT_55529 [Saccharata proteae CBS 121410]|uniref:DUF7730 domain-containing protein n=1 Tax=Saccharata proteae CBS 121410 TaxID=1314787 RepID=A0A6A5YAL9_9PEZI|nr:hypothetical protein K490DRAFT_55529 [Saccharata proteae CBS 121410]
MEQSMSQERLDESVEQEGRPRENRPDDARPPSTPPTAQSLSRSGPSNLLQKLPAELRIRIYEYTLGGNRMHIHRPDHEDHLSNEGPPVDGLTDDDENITYLPALFLEFALGTTEDRYPTARGVEWVCPGRPCYSFPYVGKWGRLSVNYDMNLLLACRQLYAEARLLPFKENLFLFSNLQQMQRFVNFEITADQASSIRKVAVRAPFPGVFPTSTMSPDAFKPLSGLDHLILQVDINLEEAYENSLSPLQMFDYEKLESWLPALARLPVKKLTMLIYGHYYYQAPTIPDLTKDAMSEAKDLWSRLRLRICPTPENETLRILNEEEDEFL